MIGARVSRRAGMTMIEVVVATAMLGALVAAAMAALTYASKPATEASVRSYAVSQGGQTMLKLVSELEGASFADPTTSVGTLASSGGVWTFTASSLTTGLTYADGTTADGYEGTAVRYDVVTGWNTASDTPTLDAGGPYVYAFISDPDTGALKLVRAREGDPVTGGFAPTYLTDVESGATFRKPAANANLHVDFAVKRTIGFNHQTNTVEEARAAFHQEVNLRNLNQ